MQKPFRKSCHTHTFYGSYGELKMPLAGVNDDSMVASSYKKSPRIVGASDMLHGSPLLRPRTSTCFRMHFAQIGCLSKLTKLSLSGNNIKVSRATVIERRTCFCPADVGAQKFRSCLFFVHSYVMQGAESDSALRRYDFRPRVSVPRLSLLSQSMLIALLVDEPLLVTEHFQSCFLYNEECIVCLLLLSTSDIFIEQKFTLPQRPGLSKNLDDIPPETHKIRSSDRAASLPQFSNNRWGGNLAAAAIVQIGGRR